MSAGEHPIVAYSERLGQVTDLERRLEIDGGAEVRRASLWTTEDVRRDAADATVVMVGAVEPMTAEALSALVSCRLLVRRGAGVDNVDLAAATRLGIPVAFVPDATVEEVSDHALALLLALVRRVVPLHEAVREGHWTKDATTIAPYRRGIRRLDGLTLGIVGFGRIGRALARKASGVVGTIVAFDPHAQDWVNDPPVRRVSFEDLLDAADLVSIHAALTPETTHLVDAAALDRLRPGAILVNASRGPLVDESALVAALESGRLAGAGLDVTEIEPIPADSPLLRLSNVLVTAHSALASDTADAELRRRAVVAALSGLRGERPEWLANPEVVDVEAYRLR